MVVLHFRKQALAKAEINYDADYIPAFITDTVDALASAQGGGMHDARGSVNERSRHPPLAPPTPPAIYDEVDEVSNATSSTGSPAAQPRLDVDGYVFDSSANRPLQDAEYAIAASSTSGDANYSALTSSGVTYKPTK